jgi:hypothetical protein
MCTFINNKATSTGYGNDIHISSDVMYYGGSSLTEVCSTSNLPRITGVTSTSTIILGYINNCSDYNDEYLNKCRINRICSDYNSTNCNSRTNSNTDDGPCIWIVNEEGNSGSCNSYKIFNCNLFVNELQCIHSNSNFSGNGNCLWDKSSGSGICRMNSSENPIECSNSYHYQIIGSRCVLKSCSDRSSNSTSPYPCGPGKCYFDVNQEDEGGCSQSCTNEDHFEISLDSNQTCVEKSCENRTKNSSNINGCGSEPCYFDGIEDKCVLECTEGNLYE